jgi:phage virion morphogenesis protein
MAVTMRIDVRDQRVRALLEGLLRRSHDLTPAMREIGEIVRESVMRNFREQRAPDGTAWKPSWRALREGGKTLIDTATLRNSIHVRPGPDRVAVGTPVEYAAVHQFGARRGSFGEHIVQVRAHRRRSRKGGEHTVRAHTRRVRLPWGDIPPRPFLGVRREDWGEIHDALMDYLFGAYGASAKGG